MIFVEMSGCVSKNLGLSSSLKMEGEEAMANNKHGIVSILVSDSDNRSSRASSLRRTLSADMSSKKWISQNGLSSPSKKNASEESKGEGEGGGGENEARSAFDIWASIQEEKKEKKLEGERSGQVDTWGSILSQKVQDVFTSKAVPAPYVHPLVRRSKSSLSERSLEICTESLGSETGSEGFSSYPASETGEGEEEKEDVSNFQELQQEPVRQEIRAWRQEEQVMAVKLSCLGDKKSPQRSFPPPIPSLARQDGASTYMRTRRDNGRLTLEAVAIPSKNNFYATRQDGRLVLTFAKANQSEGKREERWEEMEQAKELEEEENEFESSEEEEDKGLEEMGFAMEQAPKFSSTHGLIRVHRLALMVNKPIGLANRNPTRSRNFNDIIKPKGQKEEENEGEETLELEKPKPKSHFLPPRPRPATTAATMTTSLNVYEYYWRPKHQRMGSTEKSTITEIEQKQFVVVKRNKEEGNGDEVEVIKGCKDQKRSLLFWEPYCIATS